MTDRAKVYILGVTSLSDEEDEAIRDVGTGTFLVGKQLVTAKGVSGAAQAAAFGFEQAGGTVEWITPGTVPDSDAVIIFADATYRSRIEKKVPDAQKRGWIFVGTHQIFDFHMDFLKVLAEKGIHLPKYGGGGGGGLTRG